MNALLHSPTLSETMARNMALGQLLTNHVRDARILQAMVDIPRELFLPPNLQGSAYVDDELEVAQGRFLMAPLVLARLLQLAEIRPRNRVLVIGCMSGYVAAIVSQLAGKITATDTDAALLSQASAHLQRLRIKAHLQQAQSLAEGCPVDAPYDVIMVCGAVDAIPDAVGQQLAIGGRLVAVQRIAATRLEAPAGLGKGLLIRRFDRKLQQHEYFDAASALLPGFEHAAAFAL